ncbi:YegS/Rv2252/BmrU family lipid kinase [Acholeplasma morum]|uniref:diacylglycerol/lipid kinase family protein n=1 Tax=Paracholeplasma morum TaxID=264637 RepID=UPI00195C249B|nr:diacylglycerol kinase family protein [Paracholeplasma morum]MBM7453210.1 YegS/Rv2252/BmrU family lipid kinase [Paracholeplasma morum]
MKIGFIFNPESGKGKIEKNHRRIVQSFTDKGHEVEVLKTTKQNDAMLFASKPGYDLILVAGGDGTLNEVVNGIMTLEVKPKIGYIPTGTVNDVAHLLGIPRNVKKAVKLILGDGVSRKMDIAKLNDTYFTYAAATGKFAKASYDIKRSDKKRFGALAYVVRGITDMFYDYKIPLRIEYDHGIIERTFTLLLFLNGPRVGGVNLFLIRKSKLNDGILEARLFERRGLLTLFKVLSFFALGGLVTKGGHQLKSSRYSIKADPKVEWNTDGEQKEHGSVDIVVIKEAIEIYVSKRASKYFF